MGDAAERRFIQRTIFGNSKVKDAEAIERELVDFENEDLGREFDPEKRRPSAYVKVFEEMIQAVWMDERHLLLDREWQPFIAFKNLSYNARYCLARMLLLSSNRWYPINNFEKWKREVGENGLKAAFEELCRPVKELASPQSTPVKKEEGVLETKLEIIDLTRDEDVKPDIRGLEVQAPVAGPSRLPEGMVPDNPFRRVLQSDPNALDLEFFGEDDTVMTLEQLLDRMTVDQLKQLAKQNKVAAGSKPKKRDFIENLMRNAKTQTSLGFMPKKGAKGKGKAPDKYQQTQLSAFFSAKPGHTAAKPPPDGLDRLRKQALGILGKCYRVNFEFYKLVRRVHIIYFRCTEHPAKLMVPALLTRFKKRTYPDYVFNRDPEIWTSRHHLLDYEKALELEALVDETLEAEVVSSAKIAESVSAPVAASSRSSTNRFVTPAVATSISARTPSRTNRTPKMSNFTDPLKLNETPKGETPDEDVIPDVEEEVNETPLESVNVKKAKVVAKCLDDWLLHNWEVHLELKRHAGRPPSLQRFECGYVYTRLLRRSLKSLQALKQYDREIVIIELLLGQTKWLRGKRWKLYERRAIVQMTHLWKMEGKSKMEVLQEAMEGIKQALEDDDTHLVARPGLVKRIRKLEKTLKVPPEEVVQCEGELREATIVVVKARRIHHRASSLKLDDNFNVIGGKENTPALIMAFMNQGEIPEIAAEEPEKQAEKRPSWRRKGKSVWEGRNPSEELTVEDRALQHYQDRGFKGHHAETSVLTTIWVLMNWDIVFADVRGAFETQYQSAPLDIVDDSFYLARKEMFDQRLEEIKEGKAAEYIVRHDTKYRVRDTWAIGVSWKLELPDLVEIVECLGGHSLEKISRLFCEDYVGRSSGGPDLIVWNYEKQICKFVEVKGPGDKPSENQKLWFDSLLGAGIQVEICKIEDINDVKTQTSTRKGKGKTPVSSVPRKRKQPSGNGKSDSGMEDEIDYEKLDCNSDDELPQHNAKRRRKMDPCPLSCRENHEATPSKNGGY